VKNVALVRRSRESVRLDVSGEVLRKIDRGRHDEGEHEGVGPTQASIASGVGG
jgi:ribosomal protein L28